MHLCADWNVCGNIANESKRWIRHNWHSNCQQRNDRNDWRELRNVEFLSFTRLYVFACRLRRQRLLRRRHVWLGYSDAVSVDHTNVASDIRQWRAARLRVPDKHRTGHIHGKPCYWDPEIFSKVLGFWLIHWTYWLSHTRSQISRKTIGVRLSPSIQTFIIIIFDAGIFRHRCVYEWANGMQRAQLNPCHRKNSMWRAFSSTQTTTRTIWRMIWRFLGFR